MASLASWLIRHCVPVVATPPVNGVLGCGAGESEDSVDRLSFETLICTTQLARYLSVLRRCRRVVVGGPSGSGKTHLALALAHSLMRR